VDPEVHRQRAASLAADRTARTALWHAIVQLLLDRLEAATDTEFKVHLQRY
jgi:hypothetical protein